MAETVFAAFEEMAARNRGADFLSVPASSITLSYGQVLSEVTALRRRYSDAGYGHGHRVALLLENHPAFLLHWLALNALGAAVVPVNPYNRKRELAHLLRHSGVILAVVLAERLKEVRAAAEGVLAIAETEPIPPAASSPPREDAPASESLCGLLYTSGTTGEPKGCLLSNGYYLRMGRVGTSHRAASAPSNLARSDC